MVLWAEVMEAYYPENPAVEVSSLVAVVYQAGVEVVNHPETVAYLQRVVREVEEILQVLQHFAKVASSLEVVVELLQHLVALEAKVAGP